MLYHTSIIGGLAAGVLARLFMLRLDYRQYPTYPHDIITHIALGSIAALIGAVFIPALLFKQYTAVTFLALAAEQFRNVRNMERETLTKLEETELVPRGIDYIEGIARTFEARNYLTIFTAVIISGVIIWSGWFIAIVATMIIIPVWTEHNLNVHLDPFFSKSRDHIQNRCASFQTQHPSPQLRICGVY
jgi:hypothetical protein